MTKTSSSVGKGIKNAGKEKRKSRLSPVLKSLLERADQARREFKYHEAVERYSQAIDSGKLDPIREFDAVYGRFLMFVDDFSARRADAEKMIKLARKLKDPSRQVLALVAHARSAGIKNADTALSEAKAAYKKARKLQDQNLEANALYALGRSYDLKYEAQTASVALRQAVGIYQAINDQQGKAIALRLLGSVLHELGRANEATQCYEEALVISRRLGDRASEAATLVNAADYSNDFAKKLDWSNRSLRIHKELEMLAPVANNYNSLSMSYTNLGLYRKACDLGELAVQISRDNNNKDFLSFVLETLARPYLALHEYEKSFRLLNEGLIIISEQRDLVGEGVYLLTLGRMALAQMKLNEARKHFQAALPLFQQSSEKLYISSAHAWLAAVLLALGHEKAALKHSAQAAAQLQQTANLTFDYPSQEIWWWRYKILAKTKSKKEAFEALQKARQLMLDQVANISDEGLRRNYLNKVEINRDIMLEWAKKSGAKNVALELPETRVGSLHEQLNRITEIGTQLNEHHDEEKLLDLILDEVVELSGVERAMLLIKDEHGELFPAA
jgi:tetratricopeptide (TPR) repeat protein